MQVLHNSTLPVKLAAKSTEMLTVKLESTRTWFLSVLRRWAENTRHAFAEMERLEREHFETFGVRPIDSTGLGCEYSELDLKPLEQQAHQAERERIASIYALCLRVSEDLCPLSEGWGQDLVLIERERLGQ